MSNRLAVAICCHHKPWLIMSTLLSLALQDFQEYDIFIIFQDGEGIESAHGFSNNRLSPEDLRVLSITRQITSKRVKEIHFDNDDALDSGAWYKFIRTKKWVDYDYVFMLQEGGILTRTNVLSTALAFLKEENIHFLSSGHEKRRLSKDVLLNYNTLDANPSEVDYYHNERINEVCEVFCRYKLFKVFFNFLPYGLPSVTQNHVPDVFDSIPKKFYQSIRSWRRFKEFPMFGKVIYQDTYRRQLKKVVPEYTVKDKIVFHKDNSIGWFGCSCQHLVSRTFLEKFSDKLEKYSLYDVLHIPFSGTALEPIWGFIPAWFGYDKWFFDGIHRVRKNFVTYEREDTPEGICRYLNAYFRGKIKIRAEGDYIKIKKIGENVEINSILIGKHFLF